LLEDFNLLVSTSRGNEREACSEIKRLLAELGDQGAVIDRTPVIGLVVAKTGLDPFEVVQRLRVMLRVSPEDFRYALKITPIERVVSTDLKEIKKVASEFSINIQQDEKFRVTVEKRHSELSMGDIIKAVAAEVDRPVDLKNPDKIILIEVLGKLTGISVIKPADILSIVKERWVLT
jgi:tRNA acetyltransferase TAN1